MGDVPIPKGIFKEFKGLVQDKESLAKLFDDSDPCGLCSNSLLGEDMPSQTKGQNRLDKYFTKVNTSGSSNLSEEMGKKQRDSAHETSSSSDFEEAKAPKQSRNTTPDIFEGNSSDYASNSKAETKKAKRTLQSPQPQSTQIQNSPKKRQKGNEMDSSITLMPKPHDKDEPYGDDTLRNESLSQYFSASKMMAPTSTPIEVAQSSKRKRPVVDESCNSNLSKKSNVRRLDSEKESWLEEVQQNMYNLAEKVPLKSYDCPLFFEDLDSDDELYIIQSPKEAELSSLVGKRLELSGESILKICVDGVKKRYECFSQRDSMGRYLNMIIPSRNEGVMKFGTSDRMYQLNGSIVISECFDELETSSAGEEISKDKSHQDLKLDQPFDDLGVLDQSKTVIEELAPSQEGTIASSVNEVSPTKKKKKKKKEGISCESERSESGVEDLVKLPKIKKKSLEKPGDLDQSKTVIEEPAPSQEGTDVFSVNEVSPTKKKKKKKKEGTSYESETFIKPEPMLTEVLKKERTPPQKRESVDEALNPVSEEMFSGLSSPEKKKKKKKKKDKDQAENPDLLKSPHKKKSVETSETFIKPEPMLTEVLMKKERTPPQKTESVDEALNPVSEEMFSCLSSPEKKKKKKKKKKDKDQAENPDLLKSPHKKKSVETSEEIVFVSNNSSCSLKKKKKNKTLDCILVDGFANPTVFTQSDDLVIPKDQEQIVKKKKKHKRDEEDLILEPQIPFDEAVHLSKFCGNDMQRIKKKKNKNNKKEFSPE